MNLPRLDFFTEDIIPEQLIIGLALLTCFLSVYAWKRFGSSRSGSYAHTTAIVALGFLYLNLADPTPFAHQFVGRISIVVLLTTIFVWRIFEIMAHRKSNGKAVIS